MRRGILALLLASLALAGCASVGATRGGTDRTLAASTIYLKTH